MDILCDSCKYNIYDEEKEEYFCDLPLDEDDFAKILQDRSKTCRYFQPDMGEYDIVRRQN